MFKTPQAPSHAHYTPPGFSLGFPVHDHAVYLHPGPSNYHPGAVAGALARSGYSYASPSSPSPHAAYPVAPPGYRTHQHKDQALDAATPTQQPHQEPTMAITLAARSGRLAPAPPTSGSTTSGGSDRGSNDGGSGSDGGRGPTPPEGRQRPRDGKKKIHHCWMCHKSFDRYVHEPCPRIQRCACARTSTLCAPRSHVLPCMYARADLPPSRPPPARARSRRCAPRPRLTDERALIERPLQHLLVHTGEKGMCFPLPGAAEPSNTSCSVRVRKLWQAIWRRVEP